MQGKFLSRTMRQHFIGVRQARKQSAFFLFLILILATTAVAQAPPIAFTEFQAPDAGTAVGEGTLALSISSTGAVSGFYYDTVGVGHGFVRSSSGTITEFDAPGAGTGATQGTFGGQLNTSGTIAGNYTDNSGVHHAYVRTASGAITPFDVAGAGTASGQGTQCCGLEYWWGRVRLLHR